MRLTVKDVLTATAAESGLRDDGSKIGVRELLSKSHSRDVAWPRQTAMMAARALTGASFPEIGRRMGGRDHSTIIYGARAAAARCEADPYWADMAKRVHARLTA